MFLPQDLFTCSFLCIWKDFPSSSHAWFLLVLVPMLVSPQRSLYSIACLKYTSPSKSLRLKTDYLFYSTWYQRLKFFSMGTKLLGNRDLALFIYQYFPQTSGHIWHQEEPYPYFFFNSSINEWMQGKSDSSIWEWPCDLVRFWLQMKLLNFIDFHATPSNPLSLLYKVLWST